MRTSNPIRGIVFDLAGTIVDDGNKIPLTAFHSAFAREGIKLTDVQILQFMGMAKRDHVRRLLRLPAVGGVADESDALVERITGRVNSTVVQMIEGGHQGIVDVESLQAIFALLRERKVKVGITTGYDRRILNLTLTQLEKYGLRVDGSVASDEVVRGRPDPEAMLMLARWWGVQGRDLVKVGDTEMDVLEGKQAGARTIRTVMTGLPKRLRSRNMYYQVINEASPSATPTWYAKNLRQVLRLLRGVL